MDLIMKQFLSKKCATFLRIRLNYYKENVVWCSLLNLGYRPRFTRFERNAHLVRALFMAMLTKDRFNGE